MANKLKSLRTWHYLCYKKEKAETIAAGLRVSNIWFEQISYRLN